MICFVAGPFTADTTEGIETNVKRAMDTGCVLLDKGHSPVIPHLSYWLDIHATDVGYCFSYDRWLQYTLSLVPRCDALLYLAPSPGADKEKELAETLGVRVYTSVHDVPDEGGSEWVMG